MTQYIDKDAVVAKKAKLKERLHAVATEYARQFGEVIGSEPEFWVGGTPDICCFGDTEFFTLIEMQQVIDRLPEHIRRYGSIEAVGDEIRAWTYWWLDDGFKGYTERVLHRVTYQLRPNISLDSWLRGCPREERKPFDGPDAELMRCENLFDLLCIYCDGASADTKLSIIFKRLINDMERLRNDKDKRDKEELQRIMSGKAGQDFQKAVEEETNNKN